MCADVCVCESVCRESVCLPGLWGPQGHERRSYSRRLRACAGHGEAMRCWLLGWSKEKPIR